MNKIKILFVVLGMCLALNLFAEAKIGFVKTQNLGYTHANVNGRDIGIGLELTTTKQDSIFTLKYNGLPITEKELIELVTVCEQLELDLIEDVKYERKNVEHKYITDAEYVIAYELMENSYIWYFASLKYKQIFNYPAGFSVKKHFEKVLNVITKYKLFGVFEYEQEK
jgi:hypothetical protein